MIEKFAKLIPNELKEMSGSVFYSRKNAFTGKKDLYILGLNPGGSDITQKDQTIKWHTDIILNKKNPNFSEYKDEEWKGREAGTFGLQPRILHLLNKINLNPYEIPASNICFVRSAREKKIADKIKYYIDLCWPFHQAVIENLKIKVILCFGKTAGNQVRKKLNANKQIDCFVETNNRKWKTLVYENGNGQIVIVATHPSIADWTKKDTDISGLVKKYI